MENNKTVQVTYLNQQELIAVLNILISINPNNLEIKQANDIINKFNKNILSLESYLYLIKINENFKIRQLSAILLMKKLEKHWAKLEENVKSSFCSLILEAYSTEKNYLVLKAIGEVIYRLMKMLLANQENCDLFLNIIFRDPLTYTIEEINIFEVNLYIISELIENNFSYVKEKISSIKNIIENSLKSGSNKMKENASKCLGNLLKTCRGDKNNFEIFEDLIPFFISELKNFSEDTIKHIFENLCDLNRNSFIGLEKYFDNIFQLTIDFLLNSGISNDTKLIISEFLILLAEFNKQSFKKDMNSNIIQVLHIAYKFAASPEFRESDEDYLDKEYPLYDIGERLIESFSLTFESSIIFPACVEISREMLGSQNPLNIKAAIISLGLLAEGCSEILIKNLSEILNIIVQKFEEEEKEQIIIKSACIIAVDKLKEFCWPNILEFQDKVIPMLIHGITPHDKYNHEKNLEDIINKSLICLQYFCKDEELNLNLYIQDLLPKLIFLLRSKSISIQKNSLSALGFILENASNLTSETIHQILETCKFLLENQDATDDNDLKASVLECVSHVVFSVKLLNFGNYIQYFTVFAFNCVKTSVYELQDAGFVFLGSLAKSIGSLFATELKSFMQITFNVLKDESGLVNYKVNDEFSIDSDSESEVEENGRIKNIKKNETFIDAKCSAILALSHVSRACPFEFLEFIPEVLQIFDNLYNLYDENINIEIILAYESLLVSIYEGEKILAARNIGYLNGFYQMLSDGNPQKNCFNSLYLKYWIKDFLTKFEKILEESENKNEIVNLLESITGIIDNIGKDLFINENAILMKINNNTNNSNYIDNQISNNFSLDRIIKIIKILLNSQANCQLENQSDSEDPDEIDYDEEILLNISNLIVSCSEKLGDEFGLIFENLYFENLKNHLPVANNSAENIAFVYGCIADSLCNCKISIKNLHDDLLSVINENLNNKKIKKYKSEFVIQNIAYLIGVMFENDPNTLKPFLDNSLNCLNNLIPNTSESAKDNVIAALAKTASSQKVQNFEINYFKENVLKKILENIPLKSDPRKNLAVFILLENSVKDNFQFYDLLINYADRLFSFVKYVSLNEILCGFNKEILKKIKNFLEQLTASNQIFRETFSDYMEKGYTNEEEKNNFISIFQNL